MANVRTAFVLLLVVAFMGARLTGLHLHLCFDGTEAPASVQTQTYDIGQDLHDDLSRGFNQVQMDDLDVDLTGNAMLKLVKVGTDVPVLIAALVLFFLAPRQPLEVARALIDVPVSRRRPGIRPPLRAPPL